MTRLLRLSLRLLPVLALTQALGGCVGAGIAGGIELASVAVFGRDVVDIGVSAVTGRDCSVVRLDRRQPYCTEREGLPGPSQFCTKTLGTVQCWIDPEMFASVPRSLADTPSVSADQIEQITSRWPKSLHSLD
jgi:hypothetical protein